MPSDDQEFENIINGIGPYKQEGPYGTPTVTQKPGLTKRGKLAIGIGAVVIGGSVLIGYQTHTANMAEQENKAQELALKMKSLELQEMKTRNEIAATNRKQENEAAKERQASINACVKNAADQAAKQAWAPSRSDLIADCQAQYQAPADGTDMAAAGSSEDTGDGDGPLDSTGLLVAGGALAVLLALGARRGARSNAA